LLNLDSGDDNATSTSETTTPSSNSTHSDNTTTEATTTITTAAANITGKNDLIPKFITHEVKKMKKVLFSVCLEAKKASLEEAKISFCREIERIR